MNKFSEKEILVNIIRPRFIRVKTTTAVIPTPSGLKTFINKIKAKDKNTFLHHLQYPDDLNLWQKFQLSS